MHTHQPIRRAREQPHATPHLDVFSEGVVADAIALVQDLVAAFQGRDQDVRAVWILDARDAVLGFAKDVKAAFENIIKPAFDHADNPVRLVDSIASVVPVPAPRIPERVDLPDVQSHAEVEFA